MKAAAELYGEFANKEDVTRARREIGENDVVVFATGDEHQPLARFNSVDLDESVFDGELGR